jgi:ubiquinone/menaquinone biosynthesis C-methylase UbiE
MVETEQYWEERSRKYKNRFEGVMNKSFPLSLNLYLDEWMFKKILTCLGTSKKQSILDIGCGYGRISEKIIKRFPGVELRGVDISKNYVKLYNQHLSPRAKAYHASAEKLPFPDASFNLIIISVTLLYVVELKDQEKVLSEVFRVLKPSGRVIIIEPSWISRVFTVVGRFFKEPMGTAEEVRSVTFSIRRIKKIMQGNRIDFSGAAAIPIFSLALPILFILNKTSPELVRRLLRPIKYLDTRFYWWLTPSMYVSYTGVKS